MRVHTWPTTENRHESSARRRNVRLLEKRCTEDHFHDCVSGTIRMLDSHGRQSHPVVFSLFVSCPPAFIGCVTELVELSSDDLGVGVERRMSFSCGTVSSEANSTLRKSVCWHLPESMAPVISRRDLRDGGDPDAGQRAEAQHGRGSSSSHPSRSWRVQANHKGTIHFESFCGQLSPARRRIFSLGGEASLAAERLWTWPSKVASRGPSSRATTFTKRGPQSAARVSCTTAPLTARNFHDLAGFFKAPPASGRDPMSWEACVAIAVIALTSCFDGYFRPSECLLLTGRDVHAPQSRKSHRGDLGSSARSRRRRFRE